MRGIIAGHRAGEPVFRAMSVDPFPDVFGIGTLSSGDVDGAAMAIAARSPASAMQGVAAARLEAGGETLAVVVTECAQHRPVNPVGVHRASRIVDLLAEPPTHAPHHLVLP